MNEKDKQLYELVTRLHAFSVAGQTDYAKWIIASFLAIFLGGFIMIGQAGVFQAKLLAAIGLNLFFGLFSTILMAAAMWGSFYLKTEALGRVGSALLHDENWKEKKWMEYVYRGLSYLAIVLFFITLCNLYYISLTSLEVANYNNKYDFLNNLISKIENLSNFFLFFWGAL